MDSLELFPVFMLRKMWLFVVVVLLVGPLNAVTTSQVYSLKDKYLSPTDLPSLLLPITRERLPDVHLLKVFLPSKPIHLRIPKAPYDPSPSSAPSLTNPGSTAAPSSKVLPKHHHHHHHHHHRHRRPYVALPPAPAAAPGCGQTCLDPLTSKPIGSPCGCVIPMKVRLLLNVAVYALFPEVNELEIEVAAGTFLKHSQVQIVGASADSQDQERTIVDINLVPLGNKFDNTTATLISERFWPKEVPLNRTLFGSYEVVSITYPGIPSPPPSGSVGIGPSGSVGDGQDPITADVIRKNHRKDTRTMLSLVVFSAVIVSLCFFAAVCIITKCRKVRKPSNAVGPIFTPSINKRTGIGYTLSSSVASSTSMSLFSSMPTCALSMKTFSLAELEKATEKFSRRRILGEGGFGRVYHGVLEDGTEAAVKLLTRENQNGDREFIAEVEILSRLHHRNLVKLIGICLEGQMRCLVYELVRNGSVDSHLHGPDKEKGALDWDARMKIAIGSARGLAYLHEDSNPRVIHRDFKASNVLLEDDFTPKVSDFGLAREATEGSHHVSTRVMGTFGYVAPEYAMTGHLLVKSDVYSYGVVLLELLTGKKPVDMSQPEGDENLVTWARPLLTIREGLEQLVDPSLAGTYNFNDIAKVAAIASMCVHPEVTHRPFMGEVVQALKLIYNDGDETCGDYASQLGSSVPDPDSNSDMGPSDSSWWNAGGLSPGLNYGQGSAFITMDYSSGPIEDTENRPFSASNFGGKRVALPIQHGNRSGPLKTIRSKPFFNKLKGSMSEHGGLLPPRQSLNDRLWV